MRQRVGARLQRGPWRDRQRGLGAGGPDPRGDRPWVGHVLERERHPGDPGVADDAERVQGPDGEQVDDAAPTPPSASCPTRSRLTPAAESANTSACTQIFCSASSSATARRTGVTAPVSWSRISVHRVATPRFERVGSACLIGQRDRGKRRRRDRVVPYRRGRVGLPRKRLVDRRRRVTSVAPSHRPGRSSDGSARPDAGSSRRDCRPRSTPVARAQVPLGCGPSPESGPAGAWHARRGGDSSARRFVVSRTNPASSRGHRAEVRPRGRGAGRGARSCEHRCACGRSAPRRRVPFLASKRQGSPRAGRTCFTQTQYPPRPR